MSFKIEIVNTALRVTDTLTGEIEIFQPSFYTWYLEDHLEVSLIKLTGLTSQVKQDIDTYYLRHPINDNGYPIADCVDSNDVVFTAETFRTFASENLGKSSGGSTPIPTDDFLNKVTTDSQTVAGPVEFLQDITVPSGSVILGKDGAKVSSASRAMLFTDSRMKPTLFAEYHYDENGSEIPHYWDFGALQSNFEVNPDDDGTIFTESNLAFVGSLGDTATVAFYAKPMSVGDLRIQIWEGSDDTGAVLLDFTFTTTVSTMNTIQRYEFPVPIVTETGDMQFVRLSGVDLSGGLQTAGAFIGEEQPFLEFDVYLLKQMELSKKKASFLVDSNDTIFVPELPSYGVPSGMVEINPSVGFEIDNVNNAIRNISGRSLRMVGQLAFQYIRSSGGGTTDLYFFSESSSDNGLTWTNNENSLRQTSIGRDGIDYKSGISFTENDWHDGVLIRFGFYRDGRATSITQVSDTVNGELIDSHSFVWYMNEF